MQGLIYLKLLGSSGLQGQGWWSHPIEHPTHLMGLNSLSIMNCKTVIKHKCNGYVIM